MLLMITVMVLDDEHPALRQAERVLRSFPDVQIGGLFTNEEDLLYELRRNRPDLVMLDMELAASHGLDVAEAIATADERIAIVFVTAYDQYAVKAFEIAALDYVMKPISKERLAVTLQRYRDAVKARISQSAADELTDEVVSICCFDRLSVRVGQRVATFMNSKSEELLAYLIHHQEVAVNKELLIETLWPGRDYVRAKTNLYSAVYQLRKDLQAIGLSDVIEQSRINGGSYRFRMQRFHCDIYEFDHIYHSCKYELFQLNKAERAIQIYGSGYLTAHDYDWAVQRREELASHYTKLVEMCIHEYVLAKRYPSALNMQRLLTTLYPYDEMVHAQMIALLLLQKKYKDAKDYMDYIQTKVFAKELGISYPFDFAHIAQNPLYFFRNADQL